MITTKQLTAVLVVTALLAVGVIGVGYAYTASTSNTENDVDVALLTITPDGGDAATDYTESFETPISFNTVTEWDDDTSATVSTATLNNTIEGATYGGEDIEVASLGSIEFTVAKGGSLETVPYFVFEITLATGDEAGAAISEDYDFYAYDLNTTTYTFYAFANNVAEIPYAAETESMVVGIAVALKEGKTAADLDSKVFVDVDATFKAIADEHYFLFLTAGENMTLGNGSGALVQYYEKDSAAITSVVVTDSVKNFDTDKVSAAATTTGLTLTIDGSDSKKLTISGNLTKDVELDLTTLLTTE